MNVADGEAQVSKSRLLSTLQIAIDKACTLDPQLPVLLAPLAGKIIKIELSLVNKAIFFVFDEPGVIRLVQTLEEGTHEDLLLQGSPIAFARMAMVADEHLDLGALAVTIHGDAGLAQRLRSILQRIDVDWEGHLARYTGEMLAHRVGQGARRVKQWLGQGKQTLTQNVSEYLQEESAILPTSYELEHWFDQVDELRDDTERLLLRWQQLQEMRRHAE